VTVQNDEQLVTCTCEEPQEMSFAVHWEIGFWHPDELLLSHMQLVP
jgi:hypothetical protein